MYWFGSMDINHRRAGACSRRYISIKLKKTAGDKPPPYDNVTLHSAFCTLHFISPLHFSAFTKKGGHPPFLYMQNQINSTFLANSLICHSILFWDNFSPSRKTPSIRTPSTLWLSSSPEIITTGQGMSLLSESI